MGFSHRHLLTLSKKYILYFSAGNAGAAAEDAAHADSLSYVRSTDVFHENEEESREVVALRFLKPSN